MHTKTGTVFDLNQNKVMRITERTGVTFITERGNFKRLLKKELMPVNKPIKVPKTTVIKKEIKTRKNVLRKFIQKDFFMTSEPKAEKTSAGPGNIKDEEISFERIHHKEINNIRERQ